MPSLTIFSVATGRYLKFWVDMVESALENKINLGVFRFIVFTDQEDKIPQQVRSALGESLIVSYFGEHEWPFPTLLRYRLISNIGSLIKTEYLMHLDADMLFVRNLLLQDLLNDLGLSDLALVKHPGFYRPKGFRLFKYYFLNPTQLMKDVVMQSRTGALGTWESRNSSEAYVPRHLRKTYICGGVWFGKTQKVLEMCEELAINIESDLKRNIIAKYHDESHLNAYLVRRNGIEILDPKFCYESSYRNLSNIKPYIQVVNKNSNSIWIR